MAASQGSIDRIQEHQAAAYPSDGRSAISGGSSGGGIGNILLGLLLLALGIGGSLAGPKIFIGATIVGALRLFRGIGQLGQG